MESALGYEPRNVGFDSYTAYQPIGFLMKAYGANRTYKKCVVLKAKAGAARKFKLTRKSKKKARQDGKLAVINEFCMV